MGSIGITELVIVLVIVLLVFGPGRLGSIGSALGKGIKNFRSSLEGDGSSDDNDEDKGSGGSEFRPPKN
ncbi:twin-arginine translocase TatA/TatE family subunit [Candidatus Mycalebacterium sp.]